ncbi:hypothetical protein SAMN05660337_0897 [Maridesulfovibrio ferrireducens]|uniref:Uncharacterized protein n=1 Tax=Maridesulfovibrio ferrireducens TaxID=246191 RepID=A0A1G9D3P7_9BACT|nr:hypothetical protein [Maridesulfovibrio ferrireducens]SDK58529.1 hypothetical protein SAMN05660337_0897 [Maridesulfovibrio ferrireducens]
MKKNITIIVAFLLGVGVATLVLSGQIQNRYKMGLNAGHLNGEFEVINFMKKNVQNDSSKEITKSGKYLDFKDGRISIVEIDGVETIVIE